MPRALGFGQGLQNSGGFGSPCLRNKARGSLTSGLGNSSQAWTPEAWVPVLALLLPMPLWPQETRQMQTLSMACPPPSGSKRGTCLQDHTAGGKERGRLLSPCVCVSGVPEVGGPIRDSIAYIYFERLCLEEVVWRGRLRKGFLSTGPLPLFLTVRVEFQGSSSRTPSVPSSSSFPSRSHSLCSDAW